MSAFLWFMLGLSIGSCVGFLLFACLKVSRDSTRLAERQWSKLDADGKMTKSLSARNSRYRVGAAGC